MRSTHSSAPSGTLITNRCHDSRCSTQCIFYENVRSSMTAASCRRDFAEDKGMSRVVYVAGVDARTPGRRSGTQVRLAAVREPSVSHPAIEIVRVAILCLCVHHAAVRRGSIPRRVECRVILVVTCYLLQPIVRSLRRASPASASGARRAGGRAPALASAHCRL